MIPVQVLRKVANALALLALSPAAALAATSNGYGLTVLLDGSARPEYAARGTRYVEALRGRDYSLRVVNPFPFRVAVALSVDGLNTIDAKRADARSARKWVLEPHGELVLDGWQVNSSEARRFTFTGERSSYGAFLGKTDDLGVIEAVFFRERRCEPPLTALYEKREESRRAETGSVLGGNEGRAVRSPAPSASSAPAVPESTIALSDEYAATGMGGRTEHHVQRIALDLDETPAARVSIRYEFRDQLVRLGVLPTARPHPLERRERATGFDGSWCPEPGR